MQPNGSTPAAGTPQAFLTVLFFDERFNLVPAADGGVQQVQVASSVGSTGSSLNLSDIKAPKNGYVFVYVSNQSDNDVFFDNFKVTFSAGNIIEENHYYAYGLKIAGISSKKLPNASEGSLKNNYLYQGAFSELDADMGWTDFELRNYDAQIGRWVQMDPYDQFASGYLSMGDDPVNGIDPDGGYSWPPPGMEGLIRIASKSSDAFSMAVKATSQLSTFLKIERVFSVVNNITKTIGKLLGDSFVDNNKLYNFGESPFLQGKREYFKSMDAAAFVWARRYSYLGKDGKEEYSAVIYEDNCEGQRVYGVTKPQQTSESYMRSKKSPGPGSDVFKRLIPPGARIVAHIHMHWLGSGKINEDFSRNLNGRDDYGLMSIYANLHFFLLNSIGTLKHRFPEKLPKDDPLYDPEDPQANSSLESKIVIVARNFYNLDGNGVEVITPALSSKNDLAPLWLNMIKFTLK